MADEICAKDDTTYLSGTKWSDSKYVEANILYIMYIYIYIYVYMYIIS